LTYRTRRQ